VSLHIASPTFSERLGPGVAALGGVEQRQVVEGLRVVARRGSLGPNAFAWLNAALVYLTASA
jgi:hypothetical protein